MWNIFKRKEPDASMKSQWDEVEVIPRDECPNQEYKRRREKEKELRVLSAAYLKQLDACELFLRENYPDHMEVVPPKNVTESILGLFNSVGKQVTEDILTGARFANIQVLNMYDKKRKRATKLKESDTYKELEALIK